MLTCKSLKPGDKLRLKANVRCPDAWSGLLNKGVWAKFKTDTRIVKYSYKNSMHGVGVKFGDGPYYWPARCFERVLSLNEMREAAKKNKFGDFKVGQKVTIVFDGSKAGQERIVKKVEKYSVHTSDKLTEHWCNTDSLYIHPEEEKSEKMSRTLRKKKKVAKKKVAKKKKKKAKAKKNKFKTGDRVSLSTAATNRWVGTVVKRVNKSVRYNNYFIEWDLNCVGNKAATHPVKGGQWWSHTTLSTYNKFRKLKVGELVRFKRTRSYIGLITKINPKIGYFVEWFHNSGSGHYTTKTICKAGLITSKEVVLISNHKNSALVADSAELKKEISPERKKEEVTRVKNVPAKRRIKSKKTSSVVKKRTSNKTKSVDGYVVRALIKNGAATKAGICVGDTITHVDGRRIKAKGALGSVLKSFKKGAKVNVSVRRVDGRVSFLKDVKLGGNKAGRATLGVISGKRKASAYNAKVETVAKKKANSALAVVEKAVADVPENEFMTRARIEMEGAAALMADMKGRDALLKARNLRRELKSELRKGMNKNTDLVNGYLETLRNESKSDVAEIKKGKRTLTLKGKIFFGLLGLSTVAATAASVAHFAFGLL